MTTVPLHEAGSRLPELVHQLRAGDEVIITENDHPVARLVGQAPAVRQPRRRGSAKGKLVVHAEDDDHLEDFKEYMP